MRKRILIPAIFTICLGTWAFTHPEAKAQGCTCDCQTCSQAACTADGSYNQCVDWDPWNPCSWKPCQAGCKCASQ